MKNQVKICVLAIVISVLVVISCFNVLLVSAGNMYDKVGLTDEGVKYAVRSNEVIILGYEGYESDVEIPKEIEGLSVVGIGSEGFYNCDIIERLIISDSVTYIGSVAFSDCDNLQYVYVPSSIDRIGDKVFSECDNLIEIDVAEDNEEFYSIDGVLYNKSTSTIVKYPEAKKDESFSIPNDIEAIKGYTFEGCTFLKQILIPAGVIEIGVGAFSGCINLDDIIVDTDNSAFVSVDGVLFSKDMNNLVAYPCSKNDLIYSVPSGVQNIDRYALECCFNVEEVVLPESVTTIGNCAFKDCVSLKIINLPKYITNIDGSAFSGCTSLKNINVPNGVIRIAYGTFSNCVALESIEIPGSVTYIESGAFSECEKLVDIYYLGTSTDWERISEFSNLPENINVHCQMDFTKCTDPSEIIISNPTQSDTSDVMESSAIQPDTSDSDGMIDSESTEPSSLTEPSTDATERVTESMDLSNPSTDSTDNSIEASESVNTEPSGTSELSTGNDNELSEPLVDKGILGDANGDGKVNIKDATLIQKSIANLTELTETGEALADADLNTKINIKDATAIQKHIAGIETGYPIGKPKTK